MLYQNFFSHTTAIISLLVCATQSSPIRGTRNAQEQIQAAAKAMYQPDFPGPYTLYPRPSSLGARHALPESPVAATERAYGTSEPLMPVRLKSWATSQQWTRFSNTSIATTSSTSMSVPTTESFAGFDSTSSVIQSSAAPTPATSGSFTGFDSTSTVIATTTTTAVLPSRSLAGFQNTSIAVLPSTSAIVRTSVSITGLKSTFVSSSTPPNSANPTALSASAQFSGSSSAPIVSTTPAVSVTISAQASGSNSPVASATPLQKPQSGSTLRLAFENHLGASNIHLYVTGLDINGAVVMLTAEGNFYYPSTSSQTPQPITANVAIPLPSSLTIPDYISSARLWFAEGKLQFSVVATAGGPGIVAPTTVNPSDPSHNTNWGFVELTYNDSGLFANLSFVDFVGLPLGIKLTTGSSGTQSAPGVPANAVTQVCEKLKAQAAIDGQPWNQLCVYGSNGNLIRVNSPGSLLAANPGAFQNYFTNYVNSVWSRYTSSPLKINTQNGDGEVACQVGANNLLNCAGDNRSYAKPTAADIFSCATGPFSILSTDNSIHLAVVPRLCAAFNRATLLHPRGNVQPGPRPRYYYNTKPNNEYSAIVHQVEIDGKGYAFPYDDVSPSVYRGVAGSVYSTDPLVLTVTVGG